MNGNDYLKSATRLFGYYRQLGEKAMAQVGDSHLNWKYNDDSNSIAIIVKHLSGNMLSRFTDFLTTDGEKPDRNRDGEFEGEIKSREELMGIWNKGWDRLFETLEKLTAEDLQKTIYIRNEGQTVNDAINRQLAHYPYHIGQIAFIAKMLAEKEWQTLSIAKNKSKEFNAGKFSQEKNSNHFTEGSGSR